MNRFKIILFTILYTWAIAALANGSIAAYEGSVNLKSHQKKFIYFLLPKIETINHSILKNRSKLESLYSSYRKTSSLSPQNNQWLTSLAKNYGLKNANFNENSTWQLLIKRVDIVPAALVLAQAANESAWGRSRFAKQGNNYFGQWCSKPGCGIIPKRRPQGATYEVRKFNSADGSIASYINNLNSNRTYRKLRQIRALLRAQNKPLSASLLATGLKHYSARGEFYVSSIKGIIRHYQLAQLVSNYSATS